MQQKRISFSNFIRQTMIIAVLGGVMPMACMADDGCGKDENNRITAELALCSVHAYNVGQTKNENVDKQLMRDVIALKTTVIAQQMEKQYEYLDTMVQRLRMQLERAVLTTKLQAAGATGGDVGSSSGGGYYSSAYGSSGTVSGTPSNIGHITNVYLENAQNCGNILGIESKLNCLYENYTKIVEATNSGQTPTVAARKQLATDFKLLRTNPYLKCDKTDADKNTCSPKNSDSKYDSMCETESNQRTWFTTCLQAQIDNINVAMEEYKLKYRTPEK